MSSFHINDIENILSNSGWRITRSEGDDFDISEVWALSKYQKEMSLIFEGMGDFEVLPIEKSYACHLYEDPSISLYFSKKNKTEWKKKLAEFIARLEDKWRKISGQHINIVR